MHTFKTLAAVAIAMTLLAPTATAQTAVADETNLVNQYLAHEGASWSPAWWNALGRYLTLSVDGPVEEVQSAALQNVIFFAVLHRDKVDLRDAVPQLLDIYANHPEDAVRVMAVAALHAIGDDGAMMRLYSDVRKEASPVVRKTMIAAVHAYYREHPLLLTTLARP